MRSKILAGKIGMLALLAGLPCTVIAADYQYGYEKSSQTTTDAEGAVSQTTVEQSWGTKNPMPTQVTDVNAPADAQPGVSADVTSADDDAAGQHSQQWYQTHLQRNGRYVFNPDTGRLEPVADNPELHRLNRAAREKSGK